MTSAQATRAMSGLWATVGYEPEADLRLRYPEWSVAISADLGPEVTGAVDADTQTVLCAPGLTVVERRSTVAHEIVHIDLGQLTPQPAYIEELVDAIAASRLITAAAFMEACRMVGHQSRDLARALRVDHPMMLAWGRARAAVQGPDDVVGAP